MGDHSLTRTASHSEQIGPGVPVRIRDILILSASTGAGHDSVAMALQEAMLAVAPEVRVRVFDALAAAGGSGLLSTGRWYDATVEYAPWLWRLFYRATNREWAVRIGMAAGTLLWGHRLRAALHRERPTLVVSVHPLCTRLAAAVLRTVPDAPPLHCVVTDLVTVHSCWASDAVKAYYVATSDASDALIATGIPRERIHVTGLPLRGSFVTPDQDCSPDSEAGGASELWHPEAPGGRPPDTEVQATERKGAQASSDGAVTRVLLLGGGCPSRRIERVAHALLEAGTALQLVVVCGRNEGLRRRLTRTLGERARVLGWRDDVAALMRWSDVVVTKGGPTTVAEALSQARPVVIFEVLEDQETGNVALVERTGSGRYIPDVDTLRRTITAPRRALPAADAAHAAWLGRAAQRVTTRLLTAEPVGTPASPPEAAGESGHVIHNPVSGERIIIRQSAEQTGGQLLSFDLFLPPGAHVPARHVHPHQEETFTVVAGQMRFRLGWRHTILANPGDTVVVPPGTAHWFGNAGQGVAHARVEARPALRLQEVFERSAAMEVVERFPGARMPRLSDLALFMIEFQRELAVPDVPAFLVKAFLAPLAWLGERRTRQAHRRSAGE